MGDLDLPLLHEREPGVVVTFVCHRKALQSWAVASPGSPLLSISHGAFQQQK